MPHTRPMPVLGGLLVLLTACTASVSGSEAPLSVDAGAFLDPPPTVREPPCEVPDDGPSCSVSYPPFLCEGHCPGGELCCVTGVRPLGVCRTLDGCADQCAYDCGIVGQHEGPRARLICEAFCVAVAADVTCE